MWFNKKDDKHYKFSSLRTYAWDRTINNTRRYRKVFDKSELNYLSVGLEFFNKLFDEKEWKAKVTFKAYELKNEDKSKLICEHTDEYTITKDLNIAICDYGYGNDLHGSFWNEGDYVWDVYIDDEFIASTKFHIYNIGKVSNDYNPYFGVDSIKTFEYVKDTNEETESKFYLKQFMYKYTKYIMTELNITNRVAYKWLCELNYNYYDDSGLLIGSSHDIGYINSENTAAGTSYTMENGWGSPDASVWLKDNYRVEVVFMETVIAKIEFSVDDEIITADMDYIEEDFLDEDINDNIEVESDDLPIDEAPLEPIIEEPVIPEPDLNIIQPDENKSIDELLGELDKLVGLTNIKRNIREYIDYVSYLQLRKEKGIEENGKIKLHSVFTGNPGTGKTTVVKLLGQIYQSMGLLSKGHVLTVESNDLISGFVRQTGKNTKEIIEKARGGILFIDEAYMLYKADSTNDFGPEAIAALITEMSDGPGDIAIMVAGYPKEMEKFINSNPGLKSRFHNYYHFNDYTPNELVDIAKYAAIKKEVKLSKEALKKLKLIVTNAFRKRTKSFGNARLVHSMIEEAKMNLGIRLIREHEPETLTKEMLLLIEAIDIEDLSQKSISKTLKLDVDEMLLKESLAELNRLTGLTQIKKEVQELVRLSKYYREIDRNLLKAFSMHSVFSGNPGTGKTTVARILSKIYKALGLLERGHLVEADGSSLIAGFVGQSALKTKELIKSAQGGILFIDEAYAITDGSSSNGGNDFGKKAIAALIKEMEDHRGEFGVIVAGYTGNMKRFLEANPGMKSRFDQSYQFEDFNEIELWEITNNMLFKYGLTPNPEAETHLKAYINHLYKHRNKFFGNARSIRKIVEKSFRNQQLRMANLSRKERTKTMMKTLVLEDVLEFDAKKLTSLKSSRIGYKTYN